MTINPESVTTDLSVRIAPDRVHRAGSQPFDEGTRLRNGSVTHRPDVVVQPASEADVQSTQHCSTNKRVHP
jgi:hypothetical protein